jgi:hypothetical protein
VQVAPIRARDADLAREHGARATTCVRAPQERLPRRGNRSVSKLMYLKDLRGRNIPHGAYRVAVAVFKLPLNPRKLPLNLSPPTAQNCPS